MTRVLYCHPGAELYGADRMAIQTILDLRAGGDEVTVVVPNGGPLVDELRRAGVPVLERRVPVLRKSLMKPSGLVRLVGLSVIGLITALRVILGNRIDVVYANTLTQPVWVYAGWALRRRVLLHVREAETESSALVRSVLCLPALFSSSVIANSAATAKFIRDALSRRPPRVEVVYNGKDWGAFLQSPEGADRRKYDVMVVGRLSPRKGQDLVIDALQRLSEDHPALTVAFAGSVFPGYEWYEKDLRDRARNAGMSERVHFLGFVEKPEEAFRSARVAVVPSRLEPFGTVAAEAMACNLPVVVAGVQGLLEIVEDKSTGFVFAPEDVDALAAAILDALSDAEHGGVVAEAGKSSVLTRFSQERYAGEIRALVHGASR